MDQLNVPHDASAVAVSTTATKLITDTVNGYKPRRGVFVQPEGTVYLGGPSVTTSTGIKLVADQILFLESQHGQGWHAITSAGSVNVRVVPVL